MHILLTDIATCPRCGPQFGLILLADRIENRRVIEGRLGCANCRTTFQVHHGAAHFDGDPVVPAAAPSQEAAVRFAALMGLERGSGYALLAGPAAAHAGFLRALLDGIEVITIGEGGGSAPDTEAEGINRVGVDAGLPFTSMRIAGVTLTGTYADSLLEEGARVLAALGRLVLEPAPSDAGGRLAAAGLRIVAQQDDTVVAARV